jgi:hypothetical protein
MDANAMLVRTPTKGEEGWIANGGAGAGREVQVAAKNSGATWTECHDEVLSGKRQDVKRLPQERTYRHNGLESPRETFENQCKLNRMRVAAKLTRISKGFSKQAEAAAERGRLDPDESMKPMLQLLETAKLKSRKEMNEYSCYLCQLPIKTAKRSMNHVRGGPHRKVFGSRKRGEKGHGYNRDNPGLHRQVNPEPGATLR